jgi:hypothetical protein
MGDVTRIPQTIEHGNTKAASELPPLVYQELRRLAAHKMANEAPGNMDIYLDRPATKFSSLVAGEAIHFAYSGD